MSRSAASPFLMRRASSANSSPTYSQFSSTCSRTSSTAARILAATSLALTSAVPSVVPSVAPSDGAGAGGGADAGRHRRLGDLGGAAIGAGHVARRRLAIVGFAVQEPGLEVVG